MNVTGQRRQPISFARKYRVPRVFLQELGTSRKLLRSTTGDVDGRVVCVETEEIARSVKTFLMILTLLMRVIGDVCSFVCKYGPVHVTHGWAARHTPGWVELRQDIHC
jgi:hypothetical protein